MYLDEHAASIRARIPSGRLPDNGVPELMRLYAVLLRVKGSNVTESDIHDAWSAWMVGHDPHHAAIIPYEELPKDVQEEDRVFMLAVQSAALDLRDHPARPPFSTILFPSGPPTRPEEIAHTFELYKMMVASSEGLVSRRQGVNTFFLTINGALLTASGLIVQGSGDNRLGGLGIAVVAGAGALLCGAWRSLIGSFGQLNRGKFQVINTLERYFPAAIYAAEWEALGEGKDPKIYRSFTSREIWVPTALLALHVVTAIIALFASSRLLELKVKPPKSVVPTQTHQLLDVSGEQKRARAIVQAR
jgi:hypothetical protein